MDFKYRQTVLDAADIDAEAGFWAGLLDGTVANTDSDGWRNIWIDSNWQLGVQRAPDHVQPTWPDTSVPQQMHFDFYVVGVDALSPVPDRILKLVGGYCEPRRIAQARTAARFTPLQPGTHSASARCRLNPTTDDSENLHRADNVARSKTRGPHGFLLRTILINFEAFRAA